MSPSGSRIQYKFRLLPPEEYAVELPVPAEPPPEPAADILRVFDFGLSRSMGWMDLVICLEYESMSIRRF